MTTGTKLTTLVLTLTAKHQKKYC